MKQQSFKPLKGVRKVHFATLLTLISCILLLGCPASNHNNDSKGISGSNNNQLIKEYDSIIVSTIEIRPNPLHIWPNPNEKYENCVVIVSVINIGKATCNDQLHFDLYFTRADARNNFSGAPKSTGAGATVTEPITPGETRYVTISLSLWLMLENAENNVIGTYKVKLKAVKLNTVGNYHINENIPETLFQIVEGG